MHRIVCLSAILGVMTTMAFAGEKSELTDPVEILKKADAAAKAVTSVSYDLVAEGTGAAKGRMGKLEGSYVLVGFADGLPKKFRAKFKSKHGDTGEIQDKTIGGDGENYYVVDHVTKTVYQDMDPTVLGSSLRVAGAGFFAEFTHPNPFSDELKGKSHKLMGSKSVNGEDCYEVFVEYDTSRGQKAVWCFSKKDFLPRSRKDIFAFPGGEEGGIMKTLSNLKIDPKLVDKVFQIGKTPEGYKESDDFAP